MWNVEQGVLKVYVVIPNLKSGSKLYLYRKTE